MIKSSNKTVVFILSPAHAGSTLLDLVLGTNSNCTSLGEFDKIADLDVNTVCKLCGTNCNHWYGFFNKLKKPYYHSAAFEGFGTDVLIDSSKDVVWIKKNIKKIEANIKIVRIIRNGLASLLSSKIKNGKIKKEAVIAWKKNNLEMDKFLKNKKYKTVRYEDFTNSVDSTIKELCDFIKIPFEEGMKNFWKKKHHIVRGNAKPLMLVKLYFNMIKKEECNQNLLDFFNKYGFSIKGDTRYMDQLDKNDVAVFEKHGGKLNKKYGY